MEIAYIKPQLRERYRTKIQDKNVLFSNEIMNTRNLKDFISIFPQDTIQSPTFCYYDYFQNKIIPDQTRSYYIKKHF